MASYDSTDPSFILVDSEGRLLYLEEYRVKDRRLMAYSMQPNRELLNDIFSAILKRNGMGYLLS